MNINIKKVLKFLLIFILIFCINYFIITFPNDEYLIYGFSYNITKGLIPYVDYNMVILPFHSLFIGSLMMIFGNSYLIYHLICATLETIIIYFLTRKLNIFKSLILVISTVVFDPYSYNVFIGLIIAMILLIEVNDYKHKDILIGLLIGYIMMTKINIGAFIFLAYFIKSNKKVEAFLYCSIIPVITLLYLCFSNSLFECIDYCILGLKNFRGNLSIELPYVILAIIYIIYVIYKYYKTKDKNYYYLIAYSIMFYPILGFYHLSIVFWVLFYYLFLTLKSKENIIMVYILLSILSLFYIRLHVPYNNVKLDFLGNRRIVIFDQVPKYAKYIKDNYRTKKIYIFEIDAYLMKLEAGVPINKYDLINRGNMGHDDLLYLDEIDKTCNKEECVILSSMQAFNYGKTQLIPEFKDYLLKNYYLCEDDFVYCEIEKTCSIHR